MRLIDADELINQGYEIVVDGLQYDTCNKSIDIDDIPTAYSIDRVVEEIEKANQGCCNYCGCDLYSDDVIEIVKHGGVGTETETIRDKAVKWNNNSTKKVPYEFIDYVEGKLETDVSDDVCEWEYNDSEYYFESSCEHLHIFMSDGPKENEYRFCPYCGKKIKIVGD